MLILEEDKVTSKHVRKKAKSKSSLQPGGGGGLGGRVLHILHFRVGYGQSFQIQSVENLQINK